jgi:hypothetical protein
MDLLAWRRVYKVVLSLRATLELTYGSWDRILLGHRMLRNIFNKVSFLLALIERLSLRTQFYWMKTLLLKKIVNIFLRLMKDLRSAFLKETLVIFPHFHLLWDLQPIIHGGWGWGSKVREQFCYESSNFPTSKLFKVFKLEAVTWQDSNWLLKLAKMSVALSKFTSPPKKRTIYDQKRA